jgi:hypothetical protein
MNMCNDIKNVAVSAIERTPKKDLVLLSFLLLGSGLIAYRMYLDHQARLSLSKVE